MPETSHDDATMLDELLAENDEEFIEAAYLALLKRRPDASGGRPYLLALRNGTNKLQILHEISISSECHLVGGSIPGLQDACVRDRIIGHLNAPPAHATQVSRAEQLLVFEDTDKFIEIAYWLLMKRAPDTEGIANCRDRLRDGASKLQILHELFTSSECRELDVELPGLRDAFAREGLQVADYKVSAAVENLPQAAKSLGELLAHQSGSFVDCAYLTLLKRPADSQGFRDRLEDLMSGNAKIQILSEMAASKEAITAGVQLPGLSAAISRYHLAQLPVVGKIVRFFVSVEGNSPAERRGRATEQRLVALEVQLGERLARLEKSSSNISAIEQKALADRQDSNARIASLERSVATLRQLMEQSDRAAPAGPSLTANETAKSSGRLALELRAEEIARDVRRVQ